MNEKTVPVELTEEEIAKISTIITIYGLDGSAVIREKLNTALEKLNAPQIGDRCAFWDDDKGLYTVGELKLTTEDGWFECLYVGTFKNCAKLKQEAIF